MNDDLIKLANNIHRERFSEAKVVFLAGSLIRGEGTKFSDLDLVVVYERLQNAHRESFTAAGFPVECFVHDPETLHYFLYEIDRPGGDSSLANMVLEGIEVPQPSDFSAALKSMAKAVIDLGPPELTAEETEILRYRITDLIDDIRDPRSHFEMKATGTDLYRLIARFYLRINGHWGAKGKAIPKALAKHDAVFCESFTSAFEKLFVNGDQQPLIGLTEEMLKPYGGFCFDSFKKVAPENFRKPHV